MLDDGEAQPRAAFLSRAVLVNPVKALGHPVDVFLRDAFAGVRHLQAGAWAQPAPCYSDLPGGGRVLRRVDDDIGKGAVEIVLIALQRQGRVGFQEKLMPRAAA